MTRRAVMALMMIAKFETGRVDRKRWKLNISPAMMASLRRLNLIDPEGLLTLKGWEVEGMNDYPADGSWFTIPA